jgi:DNA polymerase-1
MARAAKNAALEGAPTLFDQAPSHKGKERSATESVQRPPLLMVLDGHAMVFRAFFGLKQPMTIRSTGEDVRGVYGFTNTLFKAIAAYQPTHVAIAFDPPGPTFRHKEYAEYKAHRPEAPPELHQQVHRVKQVVSALHMPIYEVPGYEADDVLGTIAREVTERGISTIIFTGDSDTLQLVSPSVRVLMTSGFGDQKLYDQNAVRERYGGLEPKQQIEVKALQGDTSDNIPGVPGIGAKTAIKLVQEFGSLGGIYAHLDQVKSPRIQQLLRDHAADAHQSKYLVTIVTEAPVRFDFDNCLFGQYTREEVLQVFKELEFNTIAQRIPPPLGEKPNVPASGSASASAGKAGVTETIIVDTPKALEAMAKELRSAKVIAFDTETTSIDPMQAELVGLSFASKTATAYYVPVGHRGERQLPLDDVMAVVRPIMENDDIGKVAHNANFDLTLLANYGVRPNAVTIAFDTMLAAHLLGDRHLGLKGQVLQRLNMEMTQISQLIGTGRKQITFDAVPIADAAPYAAADADMTLRLMEVQQKELEREGLTDLQTKHELPLVPVIVRMQMNGIALDTAMMREFAKELTQQLGQAEAAVYDAAGYRFNLNSPAQLADLLFTQLKLPKGKRTQTGYSTDATTLEGLRERHRVVDRILEYRAVSKLKSTYVDTLPTMVNPKTGRVHTSYNQAGSATGRVSSNDPNLQNIPIRTELGRRIRKAFVAEGHPDQLLLAADYSQVELRVLAHLSGDPNLIAAFERNEDIHAATASLVYKVPLEEVLPDMRRVAKAMNFGVIYGLSAFGISQQTTLTNEEGAQFIADYFGNYPRVREYLDETIAKAKRDGYVETLLGRRRYLPELQAPNHQVRQAGERMAVNMPVQGTAAEIIKEAMVECQRRLDSSDMRTKMLLQVHDELVFEVPKEELEALGQMVQEVMPHALELVVPLNVEIKTGETWGDMQ